MPYHRVDEVCLLLQDSTRVAAVGELHQALTRPPPPALRGASATHSGRFWSCSAQSDSLYAHDMPQWRRGDGAPPPRHLATC